jgi:phage terminase large subunit GpA-like protein
MISVIKGAQIGFSQGVIVPATIWKIANNPGNIVSLSATAEMSKKFVEQRLDPVIQRCFVKDLIKPNVIRKKNSRTGDTSDSKEFAGGSATFGGLQSYDKMGKQMSFSLGFYDDWDAAKVADKEQGNTFELLRQRFSTAGNSMKQFFISTPQTRPSNIEILYEMGDQRKWHVPCPCCGEYIEIVWRGQTEEGKSFGVTFEKDENGKLVEKSVGYTCQKCFGFFKEKHKYDMNLKGKWIPTAEPSEPGFYSYKISALCAAPGMFGWTHYAYQWIRIYEEGYEDKGKLKVFKNVVLGEAWEEMRSKVSDIEIQEHTRDYNYGTVPSLLSEKDGNEKIILLTFSCDINGTENDARLDWEVMAHSYSGSTYSVEHGSIGTYQPGVKHQTMKANGERELFTYNFDEKNSVWTKVEEILFRDYQSDDGRVMKIAFGCVDSGHLKSLVYKFVEKYSGLLIAVKGTDADKYTKPTQDLRAFKVSREKPFLYLLEVDRYKDDLSDMLNSKWDKNSEELQPPGYMNFPTPDYRELKYTIDYFKQFSAEEKQIIADEKTGEVKGWKWVNSGKKANHFWDVSGYNIAMRDIFTHNFIKAYNAHNKSKLEPTWYNFSNILINML